MPLLDWTSLGRWCSTLPVRYSTLAGKSGTRCSIIQCIDQVLRWERNLFCEKTFQLWKSCECVRPAVRLLLALWRNHRDEVHCRYTYVNWDNSWVSRKGLFSPPSDIWSTFIRLRSNCESNQHVCATESKRSQCFLTLFILNSMENHTKEMFACSYLNYFFVSALAIWSIWTRLLRKLFALFTYHFNSGEHRNEHRSLSSVLNTHAKFVMSSTRFSRDCDSFWDIMLSFVWHMDENRRNSWAFLANISPAYRSELSSLWDSVEHWMQLVYWI